MRIIHADLSAEYTGRGDTILPVYSRVIIIKDDGSILIHGRDGTKPINYMGTTPKITTTITAHGQSMIIRSENTRESLVVTCHTVHSDLTINTPEGDPGIQRDNTEEHLHSWIEHHPDVLGENYHMVESEYQTGNGPVDLLMSRSGENVLVEVKRVATPAAVHQIRRYSEGAEEKLGEHGLLLVAVDVRPSARAKCASYGIDWVQVTREKEGYRLAESSIDTENTHSPVGSLSPEGISPGAETFNK